MDCRISLEAFYLHLILKTGAILIKIMTTKIKIFVSLLFVFASYNSFADTVDYYRIYLSNKKIFEVAEPFFNSSINNKIILDSSNRRDTIQVFYVHCAKGTSEKQVKLADSSGSVLQTWNFHNADDSRALSIPVERIRRIKKAKPGLKLYLYYYDEQVLEGQLLTLLELEKFSGRRAQENSTLIRVFLVVLFVFLVGTMFVKIKKPKDPPKVIPSHN